MFQWTRPIVPADLNLQFNIRFCDKHYLLISMSPILSLCLKNRVNLHRYVRRQHHHNRCYGLHMLVLFVACSSLLKDTLII
jgi:hypothetical protein